MNKKSTSSQLFMAYESLSGNHLAPLPVFSHLLAAIPKIVLMERAKKEKNRKYIRAPEV